MVMKLPEFLQIEDGSGFIRLPGHRIGLANIVRLYDEGYSAEMIAGHYPTLPLAIIHKVIAFYLENEAEVLAYVAADGVELSRQEKQFAQSRQSPDLAQLRRRLQTMRRTGE
jgi:uncharacterized protein (DUF433 family)